MNVSELPVADAIGAAAAPAIIVEDAVVGNEISLYVNRTALVLANPSKDAVREYLKEGNKFLVHLPKRDVFLKVVVVYCAIRACDFKILDAAVVPPANHCRPQVEIDAETAYAEFVIGCFLSYRFEDAYDTIHYTTYAISEKCNIYLID